MKKWIKRIAFALLILILIGGGILYYGYKKFVVYPPKKEFQTVETKAEAQFQDLEYLALYPSLDKSFDTEEKQQAFQTQLETLKTKLPISDALFEMEVAKLAAIAENAHTNTSTSARARRMNAIPLRFYWFEEGLIVLLAQKEYQDLLGAKVVAINGMPPEQMLTYFEPYFGGAKTSLRELSPLYYMSPEILHAIGQSESADSLTIKFLKNDNTEETKTIAASKFEKTAPKHWVSDWLNPSFFIDTTSWKSEVASTELALPFQHLDQNVHHQWIENTLYVQMNDSWNTEERNVNNYLKEVLKSIENKEIDKVIYDLRFNPGGDYHLGRPFIKKVKEILPADGKCYIVTGNGTFSAGIIAAAFAKHELDEQAVIVGEDVGDNLIFWADGGASWGKSCSY